MLDFHSEKFISIVKDFLSGKIKQDDFTQHISRF